jgi:hypothetical protein
MLLHELDTYEKTKNQVDLGVPSIYDRSPAVSNSIHKSDAGR